MAIETEQDRALSALVIKLLREVIYRDDDHAQWSAIISMKGQISDAVYVLGLEFILDDSIGAAFLRSIDRAGDAPSLFLKRSLTYRDSILLVTLRKRLSEMEVSGDIRCIMTREEIVNSVLHFYPETMDEIKLANQVDTALRRLIDMRFVREMASASISESRRYEVMPIIKAVVTPQSLAEFESTLREYLDQSGGKSVQSELEA